MQYHLISTKQGRTTIGSSSNGAFAYALVAGDSIETIDDFDATPEEFAALITKAGTHKFHFDKDTGKVVAKPKDQKPGDHLPAGALSKVQGSPAESPITPSL